MNALTDNTLLKRWHEQRDARAFHELARRHTPMVFATFRRILRNAAEAEDLTQECFLCLAQEAKEPPEVLPAWLHVVAVRRSLTRLRSLGRQAAWERRYAEEQPVSRDPALDLLLAEVDEVLAGLPEDYRTPLVLHFLEQQGQKAVAEQLGVSQATVSRRIDRGIELLRARLATKQVIVTAGALSAGLQKGAEASVPPTLYAALGKLSLAGGSVNAAGAVGATNTSAAWVTTVAGGLVVKKIMIGVACAIAVAMGVLMTQTDDTPMEPEVTATSPMANATNSPGGVPADAAPVAVEAVTPVASAPDPAQTGGAILGRVLDAETNEGIPGVRITASWEGADIAGADSELDQSATTDADGTYAIVGLSSSPGTKYTLTRDTPTGYRRPTYNERMAVVLDADFLLRPEVPLGGVVVDVSNRPVAGAKVTLAGGEDFYVGDHQTTDGGGRFSFHSLPPTGDLSIVASKAEAVASEPYNFTLPEEGITDLKLVVAPACSVAGVVVDSSGNALSGYRVVCSRVPNSRAGTGSNGESDERGQFKITGLPSGNYEIAVFKPGPISTGGQQKGHPVSLAPGEQREGLTLVYDRDFAIAGRVTNTDGEALEGVSVNAGSVWLGGGQAATDSQGNYRIDGLAEGDYQVDVNPAKGEYQYVSFGGIPAGMEDLDIVVPGYFHITGRVLDARTGQPIPEFEVAMHVNWGEDLTTDVEKRFQAISNAAGEFELTQVQMYRSLVAARAPGYATAMQILDLTGPPYDHSVELKLEPGQALNGKVVDTRGAPVANADIYWGKIVAYGDRASTRSAADGSFSLPSFPASPQVVAAYHQDYAPGTVLVQGSDRFKPVEIVLSSGGTVEGRVAFADGAESVPCRARIVTEEEHHIPNLTAEVAADGTFRIDHVQPGTVSVFLTAGTDRHWEEQIHFAQSALIQAGQATEVRFEIKPNASVFDGAMTYPEGALPSRVQLTLIGETNGGQVRRTTLVEPSGYFRFEGMPSGPAVLEVDANFQNHRRIATSLAVEVSDGDSGFVEIPL